ncbi:PhaM family polyhydroxyalkanoate granule multifunctional regulatory protein [Pelomonas sp. KK5]|uniref:PhaM family polyhydroxyalkanoate granule multifunctional regulatory protein n=1 Tax=Pelomonas sp. KK5 TaxID=1855730 RepID=UPI00097BC1D0|nr:PhaM family polyhydroxyalkanoate granule multifunctional regulatory protein [Pelomonas sp. KK5]
MSNDNSNPFAGFVPGFDFLQGLVKNAGAAIPGIGQWVAPTLNPEELEKRIGELRTIQFWLEQNARMLGTTIQALEVQKMTLSTLKSMDVPLATLRESLKMPTAEAPAPKAAAMPGIDPTVWWTALTEQFTQLATKAVTDPPAAPGKRAAPSAQPAAKAAARKTAAPRKRKA